MRPVFYMAHPLGGDVDGNIARAMRWLSWLRKTFPASTFIAPWIASVIAGDDDSDPAQREAGIADALAVVPLCTGVVLVGGRVSSGMARENKAARASYDLTALGDLPPDEPNRTLSPSVMAYMDLTFGHLGDAG